MKYRLSLVAVFALLLLGQPLDAREWTDSTGAFTVEAEFVSFNASTVRLRKADGTEIDVPLKKLSAADQQFLKSVPRESAEARIRGELASPTRWEFIETPLGSVLDYLQDMHQIPIYVDGRSLRDEGLSKDLPLTSNVLNVPLSVALDKILAPLELTWLVRHDVLFITTQTEASSAVQPMVYRIVKQVELDGLAKDITANISPNSWDRTGGPGSIALVPPRAVVVSQTQPNHRELQEHYEDWLQPIRGGSSAFPPGIDRDVRQALNAPTMLEFIETPLEDIASFLKELHEIPIAIDQKALQQVGLDDDVPISVALKGIPLRCALSLVLDQLDLTWTADKAGITITTPEAAEKGVTLVAYPVKGIIPPAQTPGLVDAVQAVVLPASWNHVGGPGNARLGVRGTLDVRHTFAAHREVAVLLEALRLAFD